uniref:Uncharacterized protein n=1 Tax=Arundo donax TaxID=35708 RepID=A0A0A9EMH3_ARUDO
MCAKRVKHQFGAIYKKGRGYSFRNTQCTSPGYSTRVNFYLFFMICSLYIFFLNEDGIFPLQFMSAKG